MATGAWMEVLKLTTTPRTTPADVIFTHNPCLRATAGPAGPADLLRYDFAEDLGQTATPGFFGPRLKVGHG